MNYKLFRRLHSLVKLLAPLADDRLTQRLIDRNTQLLTALASRLADMPAVVVQPLAAIAEIDHAYRIEVARYRLLERTFTLTECLIEVNSIPVMSSGSIVPKQAKAMGISLGELFDLVIRDTMA